MARNVFFTRQSQGGQRPTDRGRTDRDVRGGGQPGTELLERRIRGGVHESPERLQPRGIKLGWLASPARLGGDVTGGVIADEEGAHTTQTEPEEHTSELQSLRHLVCRL